MITRTLALVSFACLAISTSAWANDPFTGVWKLNASRSTRTDTMKVESAGNDKYTFDFGGGPETIVVDGTDQPSKLYGGDTLSVAVEGDKWKVTRKGNGRTTLSAIWSLSKDGRTLTDRFTGFNDNGAGYTQIYRYKRTAGGPGYAGTWVSTNEEAVNFFLGLQIRPFDGNGLSIIDSSAQIMGNMDFAAPLVRRPNDHTIELMRKKGGGEPSVFLQLELSPDLKSLTITPHPGGGEKPFLAFDRQPAANPRL